MTMLINTPHSDQTHNPGNNRTPSHGWQQWHSAVLQCLIFWLLVAYMVYAFSVPVPEADCRIQQSTVLGYYITVMVSCISLLSYINLLAFGAAVCLPIIACLVIFNVRGWYQRQSSENMVLTVGLTLMAVLTGLAGIGYPLYLAFSVLPKPLQDFMLHSSYTILRNWF